MAGAALSNRVKGPRPLAGYGRGAGRGSPWDDCCSRVTWSWSACPQCSSRSLHHPQLLVSCLAQDVTHHKAQALGSLSAGDPFGFLGWTQQLPACSAPALQPSSCLASLFLTAVQRLMPRCPAKCSVPIPNMAYWGGPAQTTESQRGGVGRDLWGSSAALLQDCLEQAAQECHQLGLEGLQRKDSTDSLGTLSPKEFLPRRTNQLWSLELGQLWRQFLPQTELLHSGVQVSFSQN